MIRRSRLPAAAKSWAFEQGGHGSSSEDDGLEARAVFVRVTTSFHLGSKPSHEALRPDALSVQCWSIFATVLLSHHEEAALVHYWGFMCASAVGLQTRDTEINSRPLRSICRISQPVTGDHDAYAGPSYPSCGLPIVRLRSPVYDS